MMRNVIRSCACLLGLLVAACQVDAPTPPQAAPVDTWRASHTESQGALASVWGSGPNDVWAAGGRHGRGIVLRLGKHGWQQATAPLRDFVWWVYGTGPHDVYAAGERGLVAHYNGIAWTTLPTPTDKTLYGLWAASPADIWVVGGDPHGKPGDAVVLRGNADKGFAAVQVPLDVAPAAFFKVYGSPSGGVVAVGTVGTIARFDGAWSRQTVPSEAPIVSLWGGGGQRLFAVGGANQGVLLEYDGAAWQFAHGVPQGLGLFGIYLAADQSLFAVGAGPRILERPAPGMPVREAQTPDADPGAVLHAVWGDGTGNVYAVGGSLYGPPAQMTGLIWQRGGPQ